MLFSTRSPEPVPEFVEGWYTRKTTTKKATPKELLFLWKRTIYGVNYLFLL